MFPNLQNPLFPPMQPPGSLSGADQMDNLNEEGDQLSQSTGQKILFNALGGLSSDMRIGGSPN